MKKEATGIALLLAGKPKGTAALSDQRSDRAGGHMGEHTEHAELSDEELDEARKDAGEAVLSAIKSGDHEAFVDGHYDLHRLHHEKMRREQGESEDED